jgi:hypothetical protein
MKMLMIAASSTASTLPSRPNLTAKPLVSIRPFAPIARNRLEPDAKTAIAGKGVMLVFFAPIILRRRLR